MDFALPPVGEGLIEVELVRWLVRPGDAVGRGQPLLEAMSDKATMEVPAPFAGVIQSLAAEAGTKIKVGQHILSYGDSGDAAPVMPSLSAAKAEVAVAAKVPVVEASTVVAKSNGARPLAAPSVRHLARKLGVDLARVRGSGPAGRIVLDDLSTFVAPKSRSDSAKPAAREPVVKMDYGKPGSTVRLAGLRKIIADRMVASKRSIPHYSYIDECDVTDMVRLRNQLKDPFATNGVKLTYLAFLIAAAVRALKEVPVVNSTYDEPNQTVTIHDHYNVGFAVAVPNGLIVPVIKDADKRDLAGIANEIERLGEACRANKFTPDDLKGGTFTVTSVGNIGGLISTPIINSPEVGIMGVGRVIKRPVYDDHGDLRPADLLYLSFSFDHRIVDGAVGAAFGNAVLKRLQNPALLLMSEKR
jgi:pyruvate dehydrogenase E2 component (dihydrolipoamide acetyltransferase)/2-oxoisovalerate dehydrogenase E2 component (dihydrolipoyl transacylase)